MHGNNNRRVSIARNTSCGGSFTPVGGIKDNSEL